jgi:hypothetical protein
MFRARLLTIGIIVAAIAAVAKPVRADSVTICSGFLEVSGVQDIMSRGFLRAVRYDLSTEEYRLRWWESDGVPQDVLAPRLPNVSLWTPMGGAEELVFLSLSNLDNSATPGAAPSPFSLNGRLGLVDMDSGSSLVDQLVSGTGTVNWQFVTTPGGGRILSGATYTFDDVAPTPEPGTLLLLGVGAAGFAVRRRWHSAHRRGSSPAALPE